MATNFFDNARPPGLSSMMKIEPLPPDEVAPPLLALARTPPEETQSLDGEDTFENRLFYTSWRQNVAQTQLLIDVVCDPATDGTVLHEAAAVGNLAVFRAVQKAFAPGCHRNYSRASVRRQHFVAQKDARGNTVLHCAVRAGQLLTTISVYRLFVDRDLPGLDHLWGEPPEDDAIPADYPPYADDEQFYTYTGDGLLALALLLDRNDAGEDALSIARAGGHAEITAWLEKAINNSDPLRRRDRETERILQAARDTYAKDGVA